MNYNLGTARGNIDIDTAGLQGAEVGLRQTGFALTAVGTAMVGAVGYVIKTSADFEKSMSAVSAVTGETGKNIDLLREKALELGKQGPYGPREVAESFIELAKAGLTTQEILDGVGQATINLAAAGDLELARAGEILSNTMRTFQLEAGDAARIANVLAGAANASTVDVEDLAVSLKYAGSVAAAAGISFEDVSDALVLLGNSGIKGSTGGTSLRRILLNLQPASKKARDEMEALGIITEDGANAFFTAEGRAKPLADIFQILKDKTDGLTDAQKLQSINTIFGARASASALILMREGAEGLAEANEMVNRTTAEEVAEKRLDNLAGSILKLKAAIEAVFIEAGSPFQNVLKGIVDGLRDLVLWFGEIPQPVQTAILIIVALIGAFALLTGTAFLILAPMLQLIRLFAVLPQSLAMVRSGLALATGAARAFSFALLTNPIVLIIAAIVALVAALVYLYFKWEPFRKFIDGLWQGIQQVWDDVLAFFQGLPQVLSRVYDEVVGILSRTFLWIEDNWRRVIDLLTQPARAGFNILTGDWEGFQENVKGAADTVRDFVEEVSPEAAKKATEFAHTVTNDFALLGEGVAVGTSQAKTEVDQWGIGLVLSGTSYVQEFISGVGIALNFLPGILGQELGEMIGQTISGFTIWAGVAREKTTDFVANVTIALIQLPGLVATWLLSMIQTALNYLPVFVAVGRDMAVQFVWELASWLGQLPNMVAGFLMDVVSIAARLPLLLGRIGWDAGSAMVDALWSVLQRIPWLFGDVFNHAIDIVKGLVNRAAKVAREFASGVWNGIKQGLSINSPSNVEEAFFAMDENVTASLAHMVGELTRFSQLNSVRSTFDRAVSPPISTASIPTASPDTSQVPPSIIVQGPLVEVAEAVIRDESDITKLSRGLADRITAEQLALGKKVLNA